jgi:hypothetical protein
LFKTDGSGELASSAIIDAPSNTIPQGQDFSIEANESHFIV